MCKVSVVIPNYNGLKFMAMCMKALSCQSFSDFELLIVDNGSSDGSAEYLHKLEAAGLSRTDAEGVPLQGLSPIPVRVILLPENTGFSGAVNVGIAASRSPYVLLLNNDTEAFPDFIEALVKTMESAGEKRPLFAVSPKMIQLYHKELLDDAGDGFNLLGWAFQRGVGQSVSSRRFQQGCPVFSACAGASLYNKELLEKVRLSEGIYFDPLHFAYLEDLDLSYRARIHGYEILYAPDAQIYHVGSGTSGSRYNSFKVRLAARNNLYLVYKNMPLLQLLINLPFLLTGILIKQLFFLKKGFGKDYAAGILEGLKTLKDCQKVPFRLSDTGQYFLLELHLIRDTLFYIGDFLRRRLSAN